MPKDLKIGMALGVAVAIAAVLWIGTRPNLSTAMLNSRSVSAQPGAQAAEENAVQDSPAPQQDPNQESSIPGTTPTAGLGDAGTPDSTVYEQSEKIVTERFHIVRKGQTLSEISALYYGSSAGWHKIARANPRVIKDANKVRPGTKLIIPQ